MTRIYTLLIALMYVGMSAQAQRTIAGTMQDAETSEPIPFSNVYVKRTLVGTLTDLDGRFSLTIPAGKDTVWFGAMGYAEQYIRVSALDKTGRDSLRIQMRPERIAVDEITVKPDDAPTRLLKNVLKHKDANNPENHQRAEFEKYTRWEYSLNNISDKAQGNFILKGAQDLMQTSTGDSTRYLPVYFSETLSQNEMQREPRKVRSTILADRTKGIDIFKQYEIGGFSSAMDNEVNFYDDVVKILGVGFVSPIARDCFHYYEYFIEDSVMTPGPRGHETDSVKRYKVHFRPKNVGDKVFKGMMEIEDRHYSTVSIDCEMPKWTNINFVKKLKIRSTFQMVADSIPFYGTNEMEAHVDYMPMASEKKRLEIRCDMYNSQSKVRLDMEEPLELTKKALAIETFKADGYKEQGDDYWDEHRHAEMTEEQRSANAMIDSLNNVGTVKAFNYLAKAAITGYLDVGAVEIGPIGEMFNTNKIEGLHLGCGLRTSKEVSEHWVLSGIVGYGFKNTRPTYGGGVGYKFRTALRQSLELDYNHRLYKIGEDENILYLYENMLSTSETNIVAQLFKRHEIDELMYSQKLRLRHDKEWFTGFRTRLQAFWLQQESPRYYPFSQQGERLRYVTQEEMSLDFRFSFREKFLDDGLQRMYLSTDFPIFHITVAGGHTRAAKEEGSYARLHTTMKNTFRIGQTKLDLAVEDGIYFGTLPYTILNVARGNKTYGFYRFDYNLMNYLEFVCDKYVYIYADYSLDGLLLHKLPAIYKLGLREVVGAKIMIGNLGKRHARMLDMPQGVGGPDKPYIELNAGIDNILRFFRVDFLYKVMSPGHKNTTETANDSEHAADESPRWGFRAQFNFKL